ncbi:MAG: carbohydrate ABC transporter permease [Actinomycetes bacterium]
MKTEKSSISSNISGVIAIILMGFPVYWMITTSLKPKDEILTVNPTLIPHHLTFSNYIQATTKDGFLQSLWNSVIVVFFTVIISLAVALFASIAVARMKFKGKQIYVASILLVQMLPLTALLIPLFLLLTKLNLTDKLAGVILTYVAFVLPFVVWTLRGFLVNIPTELEEAALVDGCTKPQAYRLVLFPLIAPGLVATAIFAFIQAWNEFLLAYILLSSPEKATLPIWLAGYTNRFGTDWGPLMAGSTLAAIPVVIFFSLIQNRIATGVTAGAVKG